MYFLFGTSRKSEINVTTNIQKGEILELEKYFNSRNILKQFSERHNVKKNNNNK